ncbi:Crp/Fnr family transcriptional regulator [Listeria seeligeri]|uniref:Crp/Fnr family transcriptional regulator n=1 Tax=Listeria seeligeri TaxID=1640 RepID=UPI0015E70D17|nr:Crp/Fnr family transcriptional regulator [Listeria seeligeri]
MSTLFNYREFIQLTKKGKVNYEKLTLPKNTLIANTPEQPSDFVYLIVEGFVISSLAQKPSDVYTICSKGVFLNYYTLLDTEIQPFRFKTASKCTIYKYAMKDLEYILAMFPENYGFQFFIMKDLAAHLYYKTLLNGCISTDKVKISFYNIAKLHGIPFEADKVIIPKEIQTQVILSYSGLSRSTSYEQLSLLKKSGVTSKVNNQWVVHDQSLHDFCHKRVVLE